MCVCVCVCTRIWWRAFTEPKPPFISLRLVFTLSSHLCPGLPVNLFPSVFKLYLVSHHSHVCSMPTNLIFDLITVIVLGEALCCPVVSSILLLTLCSKYYHLNRVFEHSQAEKLRNLQKKQQSLYQENTLYSIYLLSIPLVSAASEHLMKIQNIDFTCVITFL